MRVARSIAGWLWVLCNVTRRRLRPRGASDGWGWRRARPDRRRNRPKSPRVRRCSRPSQHPRTQRAATCQRGLLLAVYSTDRQFARALESDEAGRVVTLHGGMLPAAESFEDCGG